MHRHLLPALTLFSAAALDAQEPSAQPVSNRAIYSISGLVVDSLRLRPLAGAEVIVAGTSHHATTDSSGLFTIDSLEPGRYKLGVFHPYLDSLSLAIATKETSVPLDEGQGIIFGVPSATTLIRTTCPSSAPDSTSMLMGTVVDVDTGKPVAGARVTVSWTDYIFGKRIRGLQKSPQKLETTTNSSGAYRLCGMPADVGAAVVAQSGDAKTDEIGIRSYTPSVMLVPLGVTKTPARPVTVSGFVRDEKGAPLRNARIQMVGSENAAATDDNGRFTLTNIMPGSRNIAIRRIGYIPTSINLQVTRTPIEAIDVRLAKYVPMLDTVFIKGRREQGLAQVGFTNRINRTLGEHIKREDFEKHHPKLLTDILRNTLQVKIMYVGSVPVAVPRRPGIKCTKLIIDGTPWIIRDARDFNDIVDVEQVSALEVYSGSNTPAEFDVGREHACLTIVIWSRTRVRDMIR
jgi:protocatechuate 3,4-dioxygenase beta subunit